MDEARAEALAKLLGGETWQSGGGIWLVVLKRSDGKVVVVSDEAVAEYANEEALDQSTPDASIRLA